MPPSTTSKTVLVADDTAFVRDRFKAAIESAGHRAVTAKTAAELLAAVKTDGSALDLLLIDLRLPDSSGVNIVREVRSLAGDTMPILVFMAGERTLDRPCPESSSTTSRSRRTG